MIDPTKLAVGILAALAAGGAAYAIAYPWISGAARAEQRQKAFVSTTASGKATSRARQTEAQQRREKVATSLKELEAKQQEVRKLTLERKLGQAGLDWDKRKFWMVSALLAGSAPFAPTISVSSYATRPAQSCVGGGVRRE